MKRERVLVLGATGQLGADLVEELSREGRAEVLGWGPQDLDVRDGPAILPALRAVEPRVVVNTTAYNRVDDAERRPREAFALNATAPRDLARACAELGSYLVHLSTNFVFGGDEERRRPYLESDAPFPQSVYATSKLAGEYLVRTSGAEHLVVRTAGLYGGPPAARGDRSENFVLTVLRLAEGDRPLRVVEDQWLTPTATRPLARKLVELLALERRPVGLLHLTCGGACSWHRFATEVLRLAGIDEEPIAIPSSAWPAPARRPTHAVLESEVLPRLGVEGLPPWEEALAGYLAEIGRLAPRPARRLG